jgi:hypothetical protein
MLSTCKGQHFKAINTQTRLKTGLVSLFELGISRICSAEKPAFRN